MSIPILLDALAWIAYLLVPSEGGLVDGVAAGRVETIGLLLVLWIAAHRVRIAGRWVALAVAIAASIASAAVPGQRGFNARYYASASAGGAHERSTEYRDPGITRVDQRLDFLRGERDFHLAFFNDHTRFNFMRMGDPDRRRLEFAVAWTGWWQVEAGTTTIYLHSPGASAQVFVDASEVLSTNPQSTSRTHQLTLSEGWHRLHITFSSPYGAPREFSAGEIRDGVHHPFDTANVRTDRIDGRQDAVAAISSIGKPIADLLALGWLLTLGGLLVIRRAGELRHHGIAAAPAGLALALVAAAIEALRFAWPWSERGLIMVAGDDPMTYEAYSRDILLNGILMNGGAPLGQGEPFYYQALYPYFLAAAHAIFGENMFGVLFLQRLLVAITALLLTRIAMRMRGDRIWPVALLVAGLFTWWKFAPIAADLLNESLYIPLLTAWTLSLVSLCIQPATTSAAWTGVLGGVTALARSTSVLAWAAVWPLCFWSLRTAGRRTATVTTVAACSLAVFSLIAARNWLVSSQFAATSTELGITLLGGNQPPPDLVSDVAARKPLYDRLGVGGHTAEVIEYAIGAPGHFAANLGRKALFALGFYEPYAEGWGHSPVYIATWIAALAGLWIALKQPGAPASALLVPLVIAVTQYVAVVLVYPKGERLILPIHTLLVPYAAIAAQMVWARATGRAR